MADNKFDLGKFAQIAPSIFQSGIGIFQALGAAMSNPRRPVAVVPESIKKATDISQNLAVGNMPGYSSLKGQVDLQSGQAINSLKEGLGSGPSLTGAVGDILSKQNQAMTEIGNQNATFQSNALQNYQNQLNRQGQYEDKNFNYNNIQKYQEQSAAKSALTQAGISNIFNSFKDIAGVVSYDSLKNSLFGGGQGQNPMVYIGGNSQNTSANNTPNFISPQSQNTVNPNMPTDIGNWFQYIK